MTSLRWNPSERPRTSRTITVFQQRFSRPKKKRDPDQVRRGNLHGSQHVLAYLDELLRTKTWFQEKHKPETDEKDDAQLSP